jgi:hypothetical protein
MTGSPTTVAIERRRSDEQMSEARPSDVAATVQLRRPRCSDVDRGAIELRWSTPLRTAGGSEA